MDDKQAQKLYTLGSNPIGYVYNSSKREVSTAEPNINYLNTKRDDCILKVRLKKLK
jgi:hypothetical protein